MNISVLHIVNSLEVGGLEKLVSDLTLNIDSVNHYILCLNSKGAFYCNVKATTFSLDNKPGFSFKTILKILKIIRSYSINLVHVHNQGPLFYGSIASLFSSTPVVYTRHGQNWNGTKRRLLLERILTSLADKVVAVSLDTANICRDKLRVPKCKLVIIRNGVDTNIFRRMNRGKGTSVRIGIVARLVPVKNHKCLLSACRLLKDKGYNFNLHIVGDGPLKNELMSMSTSLGINDVVFFDGIKADIHNVMNSFDVFVLPSISEGLSITLLEAMSCELPVVSTDVGGTSEIILNDDVGILVEPNNPNSLSVALGKLISDPIMRELIGLNARNLVVERFCIKHVTDQYLDIYEKLVR